MRQERLEEAEQEAEMEEEEASCPCLSSHGIIHSQREGSACTARARYMKVKESEAGVVVHRGGR